MVSVRLSLRAEVFENLAQGRKGRKAQYVLDGILLFFHLTMQETVVVAA